MRLRFKSKLWKNGYLRIPAHVLKNSPLKDMVGEEVIVEIPLDENLDLGMTESYEVQPVVGEPRKKKLYTFLSQVRKHAVGPGVYTYRITVPQWYAKKYDLDRIVDKTVKVTIEVYEDGGGDERGNSQ